MAEIVLFHHACGLTGGVREVAETLSSAGHTVHTPDLFEGMKFTNPLDGMTWASSIGFPNLTRRAREYVDTLGTTELVYGGLGIGANRVAEQVIHRPGALAGFFLYSVFDPGRWQKRWPADVPAQAHLCEDDPWREPGIEAAFKARIPHAEVLTYPGESHLFAEIGQPDYSPDLARIVMSSVVDFLDEL